MFKSIKWLYISESNLANGLKTHLLVHAWKKSVFFWYGAKSKQKELRKILPK